MIVFKSGDYTKLKQKTYRIAKKLFNNELIMNDNNYTIDMKPVKSYEQYFNGKFYGLTSIEFVEVFKQSHFAKYWVYYQFGNNKELYKALRVHKINNHLQYELD